jgi:hypothetical protein
MTEARERTSEGVDILYRSLEAHLVERCGDFVATRRGNSWGRRVRASDVIDHLHFTHSSLLYKPIRLV